MATCKPPVWPALVLIALLCSQAEARLVETWTFQRLKDAADIVLIGSVASTKPWPEKLQPEKLPPKSLERQYAKSFGKDLEGQVTTFEVATVLKGKEVGKQIELVHYRVAGRIGIRSGPILASFRKEERTLVVKSIDGGKEEHEVVLGTPQYLLFLKKRDDGRYEPVSGQVDSAFSVRWLSTLDNWLEEWAGH